MVQNTLDRNVLYLVISKLHCLDYEKKTLQFEFK